MRRDYNQKKADKDIYLKDTKFPVLDAKRTALLLSGVMGVLIVVHVLAMQAYFNDSLGLQEKWGFDYWQVSIFDLDEEASFGTWFSAVILLYASILAFQAGSLVKAASGSMHSWWMVLGLALGLMSVDEVVGIHELLNTIYKDTPWTTAGFFLFVAVGIGFVPFLWHYRWRTSGLFITAGIVFVSGAIGIERFSGDEVNSLGYNMSTALEEGLEMAGIILVIYALLDFIHRQPGEDRSTTPDRPKELP